MKQTFNIQATGAAFETLSSRLYSNPILAIIRELSSNAQDSHVMAGNEEPFNLHLPTENEPFFNIRDYGTGIPEDQIFNIYTSFFMSTKTESEDQIGAFGLGSKTPFALVDEYTVTSYYDGRKKVYKMTKVGGSPTVEKIEDIESNEPNGLNIYFKYNADYCSEYERWTSEAISFFEGTSFMPTTNFEDKINWEEFAKKRTFYTNNSIEINKNYYTNISVNVAGVKFPVELKDIKGHSDEIRNMFDRAGVGSINILAGKSDVTITPSREALHFDEKTIEFLSRKFREEVDNYYKEIENNIDSVNYNDALKLIDGQSWNTNINDKLKEKIKNCFYEHSLFCYHSGRGAHVDTNSPLRNVGQSWRRVAETVLIDFNGIKSTVKQKVVDNFLSGQTFDEDGKVTSTSILNVIKHYGNGNILFLFPKNYKDANNIKACQDFLGEDIKTVKWADICEVKKEESKKRKVGFKTRATITFTNNDYHYFWGNDPDIKDGETALIIEEENVNDIKRYTNFCFALDPNLILVVRPCKESVMKTMINKGYVRLQDFAKALAENHLDIVRDQFIAIRKYQAIRDFSHYYNEDMEKVFNDSCYDELEEIPAFKELRELYKKEVYNFDFNVAIYDAGRFIEINRLPTYDRIAFDNFPLFKAVDFENNAKTTKALLDYMLLYKNSEFYEVEKKSNEKIA